MSDKYEEVIKLVGDVSDFGTSLNNAGKMYSEWLQRLQLISRQTPIIDLNAAMKGVNKGFEEKAKLAEESAERIKKINADVSKAIAAEDAAATKSNADSVAAQMRAKVTAAAESVKIKESQAKTLERINADAARVIAEQDKAAAKQNDTAIKNNLAAKEAALKAFQGKALAYEKTLTKELESERKTELRQFEAQQKALLKATQDVDQARLSAEITLQKALERTRTQALNQELAQMKARAKELAAAEKSPATLSRGLRAGAGAAASLGGYQMAGGLYGAANVAQMTGIGNLAIPTAALVGLGGAFAVLAGSIALVAGPGGEFNQELAKMSTLLEDASMSQADFQKSLDATAQAAIRVSDKFNVDLIDVVKAFKDALSSGIESRQLEEFFDKAGELSNALNTSLSNTTNILTSFKNTYSLTVGELGHVNDVLFNLVNLGKVEVDGLSKNIGRLLPVSKMAGVGIEDLATGFAVMTSKGVTAAQTTSDLAQFISGMVNPSVKAQKAFDALGIATGDAAFAGKAFGDVISEIRQKTGGSAEALGKLFPEERAKKAASFLTDSTEKFKKFGDGIRQAGTDAVASERSMNNLFDNLGKTWKSFWNQTTNVGSGAAGWLNYVLYGNGKDATSSEAQIEAQIDKMLEKALTNLKKGGAALTADKFDTLHQLSRKYRENLGQDPLQVYDLSNKDAGRALERDKKGTLGGATDKQVFEDADKQLNGANELVDEVQRKVNQLVKDLSTLPVEKTASRVAKKELGERATDSQKQELDDLHLINEDLLERIDNEKLLTKITIEQAVARAKEFDLAKQEAALSDAVASKDPAKIAKATEEYKAATEKFNLDVAKILKDNSTNDDVASNLIKQYSDNLSRIQQVTSEAMSQITNKDREKAEKEAKQTVTDYNAIIQGLYLADQKNFEKSEEAKSKIHSKYLAGMARESDRYNAAQSEIAQLMLKSKLDSGDPDRRRYTAAAAKDAAKDKMEAVISSGGSASDFKKATEEFLQAANALKDATSGRDKDRSERNFQDDLGILSGEQSSYHNKVGKKLQAEEDANNAKRNYQRKTPEEIAKEASKEMASKKDVAMVVVDARVQLQVDGTLSPETEKRLQDHLIDQIEQRIKNRAGNPSRYDSGSRNSSNPPPSSSGQYDDGNGDMYGNNYASPYGHRDEQYSDDFKQ